MRMNRALLGVVAVVMIGLGVGLTIVELWTSDNGPAKAPARPLPSAAFLKADAIVRAAMLSPSEIPGEGWQVTGNDRGDFTPYPKVEPCEKVQEYVVAGRQGRIAM